MSWLLSICGCGRGGGLSACFLAVPLSRYRSFAIAVRFVLLGVLLDCTVVVSVPSSCSCVPASFDLFKAFQLVRFSIPSSIGCVRRCHAIQSTPPCLVLSVCLFRHFSHLPVHRLRTDGAMPAGFCVSLPLSVSGLPPFPVPPFRSSARRTGRVVVCAVSLMKRRGCR